MAFPHIVVPPYHELENLPKFTDTLWRAVPGARLPPVDDASGNGVAGRVKNQSGETSS